MDNFNLRKYLTEGKLNENKDTLSELIELLSKASSIAESLIDNENYDFEDLSQRLDDDVDDLKKMSF